MQASNESPFPVVVVVLIGRSGHGKSTLINMIPNLLMDRKYEDERLIAVPQIKDIYTVDGTGIDKVLLKCNIPAFLNKKSGDGVKKQNQSQTDECEYYAFITDDYRLVLLDTPGMIDTAGPIKDKENTQKILNAIGSMGEIHGIAIVHKADDMRVDDSTWYMLGEIQSMLSKDIKDNVYLVLTHHTGQVVPTATINVFNSAGIVPKKVFTFDNDCFTPKDVMDRYHKDKTSADYFARKFSRAWDRNKTTFNTMLQEFKKIIPKETTDFKLIATQRSVLFEVGFKVGDILREMNATQINLTELREELETLRKVAEQNKNYNYIDQVKFAKMINENPPKLVTKEVPTCTKSIVVKNLIKWVEVPMPEGQKCTTCFTCKYSCHENCQIQFQDVDGGMDFMQCTAFCYNMTCLQCTHHYEYHGHRKYKYKRIVERQEFEEWTVGVEVQEFIDMDNEGDGRVYDIQPIIKVNAEMKQRYDKAIKDIKVANQNIAETEAILDDLNTCKKSLLNIIVHLYGVISSMGDSPINNFYDAYINTCISQLEKTPDTEIPEEDKKKQIDGLKNLLQMYNTIVQTVQNASQNNEPLALTESEMSYINDTIKDITHAEKEIYEEYGKKYNDASTLEGMDCRKQKIAKDTDTSQKK